jgi:hypothetical protein
MLLYRHIKVGGQDADLGSIIDPEYGLMGGIYFFNIDTNGFPYNTKPYIDAYSGLYDTLSEIYGPPEPGSRAAKSRGGDLDDFSEYYYKGGQTAGWIQKGTLIILTLAPKTPKGFDMADWDLTVTYISPYEQESERAENRSGL